MSLTSTTTRVDYSGNGSATSFPITFAFWSADDLTVINTVTATGVQTAWTRGNQFTVSGGGGSTGTLTATAAPAAGTTLAIISALANTQPTSLPVGGQFPSASVEEQLDQIVRQVQQLAKLIVRALVQPDGDTADIAKLPAKVSRASMLLGFDSNGDPISVAGSSGGTLINAAMVDVVQAATHAAALTLLGGAGTALANTFSANQTVQSTDAGAAEAPTLTLDRFSASPAVSDILGGVHLDGRSSTGVQRTYAALDAAILDPVNATEDGQLLLKAMVAGTLTTLATLGPGMQLGAPSGGDKGAGTLNAVGLYVGGSAVGTTITKSFVSSQQTLTAGGLLTLAHSMGAEPAFVVAELQCTSADAGYSNGDHLQINAGASGAGGANRSASITKDATNVYVRFGSDANVFEVPNKGTGTVAAITAANWKLVVKAFG